MTIVVWLMGLSGSGKTTLGQRLLEYVRGLGLPADFIDGDLVRNFFEDRADYSRENRIANVRRIAFGAMLASRNGVFTIVSNIAPYAEVRSFVRAKVPGYCEVYLKATLEECARRDVKGLYARAKAGQLRQMIGVDDVFEEPKNPDLVVHTGVESQEQSLESIITFLRNKGAL